MQQDDRAVMCAGQQLAHGLVTGGLIVHIPVHIGQAPENGVIPHILSHLEIGLAVFSLRRPVNFHHIFSRYLFVLRFKGFQLLLKRRLVGYFGHVRMGIRMVAHRMTLRHHAFHQIRAGLDVVAHQKKRGRHLMFFQRVQNSRRIAVFKARVKGDIQLFLAGIPHVIGIVLF